MPSGAMSGAAAKRKRPFQKETASARKVDVSKRVIPDVDEDDDGEVVPDSSPPSPVKEGKGKGKGEDNKVVVEESPGKKRHAGVELLESSPRSKSSKKKETETPRKSSACGASSSKIEIKESSSPAPAGKKAESVRGKTNKGYGTKGSKRKAVDPAESAVRAEGQASTKESSLPNDFLEMIAKAKREKEENQELERLRAEVEKEEDDLSTAAAKTSPFEEKKRLSAAKPQSVKKQSRKEKKEATADWMEVYEESEGGMDMFNEGKDYLMAQLRKQGFDTHSILRESGEGMYTDDFCKLMVEKNLGFKALSESERQKLDKAAKEYANRRRRKHTSA